MLALDLFVLHRDAHEVSMREAATWSGVWVALGLGFGAVLWAWQGTVVAEEYLAGYLIEKALSVDNVFVFALIFSYFAVPPRYQHRVLMWGILGALVMRGAFIAAGAALLDAFHATIYLFGAILLVTAAKVLRHGQPEIHPERTPVLKLVRRVMRVTSGFRGQAFFVKEHGVRAATPLFAVLVLIETTDVVFAVDSIPAIFAVTENTFVVFTSNIFVSVTEAEMPEYHRIMREPTPCSSPPCLWSSSRSNATS